jgi:hypothetical protein
MLTHQHPGVFLSSLRGTDPSGHAWDGMSWHTALLVVAVQDGLCGLAVAGPEFPLPRVSKIHRAETQRRDPQRRTWGQHPVPV